MREITGWNPTTDRLTLIQGVGDLYFNIDEDELNDSMAANAGAAITAAIAAGERVGPIRGGINFTAQPNYEQINLDGVREASLFSKRLVDYSVRLSFSAARVTMPNLRRFLDKTVTEVIGNGLTKLEQNTGADVCAWPNYIGNIALRVAYSDCVDEQGDPVDPVPALFVLRNALNDAGISLGTEDRNVGVTAVDFMGHYEDLDDSPFAIYLPTVNAGS